MTTGRNRSTGMQRLPAMSSSLGNHLLSLTSFTLSPRERTLDTASESLKNVEPSKSQPYIPRASHPIARSLFAIVRALVGTPDCAWRAFMVAVFLVRHLEDRSQPNNNILSPSRGVFGLSVTKAAQKFGMVLMFAISSKPCHPNRSHAVVTAEETETSTSTRQASEACYVMSATSRVEQLLVCVLTESFEGYYLVYDLLLYRVKTCYISLPSSFSRRLRSLEKSLSS